ncbi:MAG: MarR family winged helix-turn-helix transcriptional regulator [Clostridiales Family XIII bacterium]|jgi:DNA-binding MarR family transcriptional regulator|nr:MarR family winged helix-turn-helix transcriptional regulator [Clostridiales Family XIII bacterium]
MNYPEDQANHTDEKTVDEILARLFITTFKIEEKAIAEESKHMLSISELHVLREIGEGKPRTMTQVARGLKISVGALTTAMNKLEAKGFVKRERDAKDRRIVKLHLTDAGCEEFRIHEEFHRNMVNAAIGTLTPEEKAVLLKSLSKLDDWFIAEWSRVK